MRRRARLRTILPVLLLAPLLLVVAPVARAAPGDLDPTFGAGGRVLGPPNVINAVAIDSQGRIVVAGKTRTAPSDFLVARYLPDGTPDPTFDGDGMVTTDVRRSADEIGASADEAFAVTIVNGDKVLVAGQGGPGSPNFAVVRYEEDGTLDSEFGTGGQALVPDGSDRSIAYAIAVQGNENEIVLAGASEALSVDEASFDPTDIALAKLDADGQSVITMTTSDIPGHDEARAMVLTEDGGVVVSGSALSRDESSTTQVLLARFTATFELDPQFGPPGLGYVVGPPGNAAALVKQVTAQGTRFVIAGATTSIVDPTSLEELVPSRFLLARFTAEGVPDTTFGTGGVVMTSFGTGSSFARALAIDGGGRLVAAGGATSNFALARYAPNGVLDTTFGHEGKVTTDFGNSDVNTEYARALAVHSTADGGKLVAGGAGGVTSSGAFSGVSALSRYDVHDDTLLANGAVTVSAMPDPVVLGDRLKYLASVRNASAEGPLYAVKLTLDLPRGVELESVRPSQGVCADPEPPAPEIRCDLGSLRPGAQAGVSLDFRPLAPPGVRTLTARATARNDARPEDNVTSASVTVVDAPGEWAAAQPLLTGRLNHTATVLPDGKVFVTGGVSRSGVSTTVLASAEIYDPVSGSWSPAGPMSTARTGHTATLLHDGNVLVAGGTGTDSAVLKSAEIFRPQAPSASPSWVPAPDMKTGRVHHGAVKLQTGEVLVVAGAGSHDPEHPCRLRNDDGNPLSEDFSQAHLRSAEVYGRDVTGAGGWRDTPCLADGRARSSDGTTTYNGDHSVTPLPSGKVLAVGGWRGWHFSNNQSDERMARPELYDPETESWSIGPAPAIRRLGHAAIARPDGSVLVAGGSQTNSEPAVTPSAELYRPGPGLGSWELAPSMLRGRLEHTGDLLSDGSVLVAGGYANGLRVLDTAERYDETIGWSSAGIMSTPRTAHTASTFPAGPVTQCGQLCGAVLVVGGIKDQFDPASLASAEIYFPPPRVTALAPATGSATGGKTVTVTGSGLASTTAVHFGGVPAASFAVDPENPDGKLTAVAPAHTKGLADVTVTTRGGTSAPVDVARFAFVGLPGQVTDLAATAVSEDAVRLSFSATDDGSGVRPASRYIVKQSTGSIVDQASFDAADSVCAGACTFRGLNVVGDPAGLTLRGVESGVTYRYALQALDSSNNRGPISNVASIRLGDGTAAGTTGKSATIDGYRLVASDGGVFAFGGTRFLGSTGAIRLNQPVVGTAATPSGDGYWLVAADGGVFAFGDARFLGSTGAIRLSQPIVGMAGTPSGNGYWLVASDGGVFAFGDARFLGSTGAIRLNKPVAGIAATPSGRGYWLIASDGGVFAFGDARFLGSTSAIRLNRPVVGVTASPTGNGYRLVASDGGIFAFGDARFLGSTGAIRLNQPIVAVAATRSGNGYRLVASDGGVFAFGDAPFLGSLGRMRLNRPVVGVS